MKKVSFLRNDIFLFFYSIMLRNSKTPKKENIVLIYFVLISICCSGCIEQKTTEKHYSLDERFIGSWYENSSNITTSFFDDGTVMYSSCGCVRVWEIKNQTLCIFIPNDKLEKGKLLYESLYVFSNNNTICTLTNLYDESISVYSKLP
jgi:hypothetical protein